MTSEEFKKAVYNILLNTPKNDDRFELEIDWETFWIKQCVERFEELTECDKYNTPWFNVLYETLCAKNDDYSPEEDAFANFKMCESLWVSVEDGIKVRLCDKVSRLRNLQTKEASVKWETIADTWLDIAGYLTILYIYINKDQWVED